VDPTASLTLLTEFTAAVAIRIHVEEIGGSRTAVDGLRDFSEQICQGKADLEVERWGRSGSEEFGTIGRLYFDHQTAMLHEAKSPPIRG
jgi:hypothetical protein